MLYHVDQGSFSTRSFGPKGLGSPPVALTPSKEEIGAGSLKEKFPKTARMEPHEALKEVQLIEGNSEKVTRIGTKMSTEVEMKLITCLRDNHDVFAWSTYDLKGIDPRIAVHRLNMDPTVKHIRQKRKDFGPVEDAIIAGEVDKLMKAGHIEEVRYSDWVCNVVIIEKAPGKWRMCIDFTRLNKFCLKDPYPLPRIDQLVDSTAGCALLSFIDAYQGFYQIRMAQEDIKKTAFFAAGGVN